MAQNTYIGIDNIARKISKGYIGVDGVARKIKSAYIGVDGVAKLVFSSHVHNWVDANVEYIWGNDDHYGCKAVCNCSSCNETLEEFAIIETDTSYEGSCVRPSIYTHRAVFKNPLFGSVNCGEEHEGEKNLTNHERVTPIVYKAPTCTEKGRKAGWYCNDCPYTEGGEEIDMLPHTPHVSENTYWYDEETSEQYQICDVCGNRFNESPHETHKYECVVDTEGNIEDDYRLASAPTCTSPAVYYKSCVICGKLDLSETFTNGSALGHDPVEDQSSSTGWSCGRCGETDIMP